MVIIYCHCILFLFQFYGNKVCVIANLFLQLSKNTVIVHYNKFSNLGFTTLIFPILKALGPLPKIAKKSLAFT